MRRRCLGLTLLAVFGLIAARMPVLAADNELSANEKKEGWALLFDGKTLDGWGATGKAEGFAVEDGTLACLNKGGHMAYSTGEWADFILKCDFKTERRVNSGVFLRWSDLKNEVQTGMEIQVLDCFGKVKTDKHDCGALYDCLEPSMNAVKPAGEWNHYEISCQGPIIRIVLNGQQIIHTDLRAWTTAHQNPDGTKNKFDAPYSTMLQKGHIGLQDHGGLLWYKNLKVKPLPAWEQPPGG